MMEAFRLALKYMTPVFVLTDGYLANGSEPWKIPDVSELPDVKAVFHTDPTGFHPFLRDEETMARVWPKLGTAGLEHRIGGLEKSYETGHISYDPENHKRMTEVRAQKIENIALDVDPLEVYGAPNGGDLLLLGWGSTYGAMRQATQIARETGLDVSHAHLRYLNPFPRNLGEVLGRYKKVLVPEMNCGQLLMLLRAKYLVPAEGLNKVEGKPFKVGEILDRVRALIGN
ncbi:MAG: 2-oxoglutarate ferredoxin oxidoreductase subunit alpha, partial [Myxococcota bacterium]